MKEIRKKNIHRNCECQCCQFPLSHRHHLLPFSKYGEYNNPTIFLCASCHEALHLMINVHNNPNKNNMLILQNLQSSLVNTKRWDSLYSIYIQNIDFMNEHFYENINNDLYDE